MKKVLLLLAFVFVGVLSFAQTFTVHNQTSLFVEIGVEEAEQLDPCQGIDTHEDIYIAPGATTVVNLTSVTGAPVWIGVFDLMDPRQKAADPNPVFSSTLCQGVWPGPFVFNWISPFEVEIF